MKRHLNVGYHLFDGVDLDARSGFLPYITGAPHPFASAPFKALTCFCLSPLVRRNSSHPLRGWSLTSKPHIGPGSRAKFRRDFTLDSIN